MVSKRLIASAMLLCLAVASPRRAVLAQAPAVQVISGTVSLSTDLRQQLETYLSASPPSSAAFYAPTYFRDYGVFSFVSLAGLNIQSADEPWGLEAHEGEQNKVVWVGTVRMYANGNGELASTNQRPLRTPKMAAMVPFAPGGGPSVRLPFEFGKAMQYGPRLIHGEGDYGTTGMKAVDLVGGDSLGTNVASRNIFASAPGEIDYVCADDHSVAVRVVNAPTSDTFVYAHLLDNATLEMSHPFTTGQGIGALRYGAFDDTCGWADQGPTIYHVHWMFDPDAAGAFAVGGYTILLSDSKFHTANTTIGSGGWITNNVAPVGNDDTGTGAPAPSFWDNVVAAVVSFVNGTAALFPPHNSGSSMLVGTINTVSLVFRLIFVLVRGELNLTGLFLVAAFMLAIRIPNALIWLIFWGIRVFRQIKTAFAPGG